MWILGLKGLISLACFFSCVRAKREVIVSHQPRHSKQRPWKLGIIIATCHSAILYFVKKA